MGRKSKKKTPLNEVQGLSDQKRELQYLKQNFYWFDDDYFKSGLLVSKKLVRLKEESKLVDHFVRKVFVALKNLGFDDLKAHQYSHLWTLTPNKDGSSYTLKGDPFKARKNGKITFTGGKAFVGVTDCDPNEFEPNFSCFIATIIKYEKGQLLALVNCDDTSQLTVLED